MIRWWINKKRSAGWKALRERHASRTLQWAIRNANRAGDFKFLPRFPWVVLLRLRTGHRNTWDFIGEFATLWAARKHAAKMAANSDLSLS